MSVKGGSFLGGTTAYALSALFLCYISARFFFKKDRSALEKSLAGVLLLLAAANLSAGWLFRALVVSLLSFQVFQTACIYLEKNPLVKVRNTLWALWLITGILYVTPLRWVSLVLGAGLMLACGIGFTAQTFLELYRKFKTTRRGIARTQLKYLAAATALSSLFIATRPLSELGLGVVALDWLGLSLWGLILSQGISQTRLPEFQIFAVRNVVYALGWGSFLGLYVAAGLLVQMFAPSQGSQLSVSAVMVLMAVLFFPKFNERFHEWTADLFYRKPVNYSQLLSKLLNKMNQAGSFEKMGELMLRIFKNEIPVERVAIVLLGEKRRRLWLHNDFEDFFLSEPEKVLNLLEAQSEIFLVDELLYRKARDPKQAMAKIQSTTHLKQFQNSGVELVMPLLFENQYRGYLLLGSKKSGETFSQPEMNFVQDLGQYLIQTSFRLEIGMQHQDTSQKLQSLHVASQALGSTHSFSDLLDKVVRSLLEMVAVDRGILFLYDDASDLLKGVAGYGASHSDIEAIQLKVKDSVLGQIFIQGQAVYVPKVTHRTEHVIKLDVESYVAAPIKLKDRVIGLFALDNRVSGRSLENINLKLLETLANQTAVAIENTRLYQEAQEKVLELSALTQQVRRKDKLSALGTMAAGVAHEIKNPLASMKLFTEMMVDKYDDPHFWKKYGNIIGDEVARLEKIVENFLGFARSHNLKLEKLNVAETLSRVLELVQVEAQKNNCELQLQIEDPLPEISADSHHLMQVFLNLILNGVQAGAKKVTIVASGFTDGQIRIDFKDNGCGISPENLDKLFTPFFTTKNSGNGLGLSIIYKIVEEHHGTITVDSKVGQGSVFSVFLPQAQANKIIQLKPLRDLKVS